MRKSVIVLSIGIAVTALIILAPISVISWEYSNSDAFCTNACHQVHPEESNAHKLVSRHREVACVECHIGRMGFFESLWEKAGHTSHAWALMVGYERPTTSKSMKTAEKSCVTCHTSEPHPKNVLYRAEHFAEDRRNSSNTTMMIMRLVGREFGREERLGLNWHASDAMSYWSSGPYRDQIHKVVAKLPDGSERTYLDVRAEDKDGDGVERKMDCLSCHNRVGHPFNDPDTTLDQLLARGTLPSDAPYLKQTLMDLYRQHTSEDAAGITPEQVSEDVREGLSRYGPGAEEGQAPAIEADQLEQVEMLATAWLQGAANLRSEGLSWRDFPSNTGHSDSPGCFRCHNGRMQTEDKQIIPVNCTTCHSIPLVIRGRSIPPYYLEQLDLRKPRDHRDPAYLAMHMDQDTESCSRCHGDIEYGDDDESHCSNSGCHGQEWEHLDLEAVEMAFPGTGESTDLTWIKN